MLLRRVTNKAQEEMIKLIVKEYCPNAIVQKSRLKIR